MATGKVVCVTGATGYIASYLVKDLLDRGYTVHGTIRSLQDKNKYSFLYNMKNASTNLRLFEADLMKDGSFDKAVEGTSIVYHTASPAGLNLFSSTDPQRDIIDPALQGTLTVLKSAAKVSSVKRVVITSSVTAISDVLRVAESRENPFTEDSWNNSTALEGHFGSYSYSKVAAEKSAWKFVEENKDKISFDLAVIAPSLNYGPLIDESQKNSLNGSVFIMSSWIKALKNGQAIESSGYAIVDVRDVSKAHLLVGESESVDVSNHRFIVSESSLSQPDLAKLLIETFPQDFEGVEVKVNGDEEEGRQKIAHFDNSKLQRAIPSFKYTDRLITLSDFYNNIKELSIS